MYKVLKLGAGGDDQSHVSTPKSIRDNRSENDNTPKLKIGMRAVSANIYQSQFNKARSS